jgi:2',3'-cyclic-nucleotide 2'-phosphodiesterase/3'-nucleotidase
MNVLDFDCGTLGNHEFNYGVDFMDKVNAGADFPIVCANFARGPLGANGRADDLHLDPYVILERRLVDGAGVAHPIKVGFIGFVPPQIMSWDKRHLEGSFDARDIVDAARAWVPEMREAGADIVIALAHTASPPPTSRRACRSVIASGAVEGIDVVMTATITWSSRASVMPGLPASTRRGARSSASPVMAGFWGSHLG